MPCRSEKEDKATLEMVYGGGLYNITLHGGGLYDYINQASKIFLQQ